MALHLCKLACAHNHLTQGAETLGKVPNVYMPLDKTVRFGSTAAWSASSWGGGTPRLLLTQISVLKMTSLIQLQIRASYLEHPQIPCHAMQRKGWCGAVVLAPSGVPLGDRFVAEPTYTGQGTGVKLALWTFFLCFEIPAMGSKVHCFSDTSGF